MCDFDTIYWQLYRIDYRSNINQQTFTYLLMSNKSISNYFVTIINVLRATNCKLQCWRCSTAQKLQELLFPVWINDKNLNKLLIGEDIRVYAFLSKSARCYGKPEAGACGPTSILSSPTQDPATSKSDVDSYKTRRC